jgi:hypothetical protein
MDFRKKVLKNPKEKEVLIKDFLKKKNKKLLI